MAGYRRGALTSFWRVLHSHKYHLSCKVTLFNWLFRKLFVHDWWVYKCEWSIYFCYFCRACCVLTLWFKCAVLESYCVQTTLFAKHTRLRSVSFLEVGLYHLHKIFMNMLALKRDVIKLRNLQCDIQNTWAATADHILLHMNSIMHRQ